MPENLAFGSLVAIDFDEADLFKASTPCARKTSQALPPRGHSARIFVTKAKHISVSRTDWRQTASASNMARDLKSAKHESA